ncbi:MAG: Ppx/GppA family phosphatase [Blastomonas sp.]
MNSLLAFPRREEKAAQYHRTAIVDIGSNSVRLVVYAGARRNPAIIFNEKVMAGLGRGLETEGVIDAAAMDQALAALRRFRLLAREMQVDEIICVATAAVRDASNGPLFADQVKHIGLDLKVIPGRDEARIAALGVISAIPAASGIVGDLGGGSLDLARVRDGEIFETATLPIGVLRMAGLHQKAGGGFEKQIRKALESVGWLSHYPGQNFYLVGGSWRAVARLDMHLAGYPLRVLHNYRIGRDRPAALLKEIDQLGMDRLRAISQLPSSRVDNLADAAWLMQMAGEHVKAERFVVSAYGLREGLLYDAMDASVRARDPLIVAARQFGRMQSRFGEDGQDLYDWLEPVFANDPPEWRRWLLAACHLADVGWQANPDFRAERGLEMALHGNWVGLDAVGRVMIAQTLFTNFGGGAKPFPIEQPLAPPAMIEQAINWGLALRLAQRLTAGTHAMLGCTSLAMEAGTLMLRIPRDLIDLGGEIVERRLRRLALALGVEAGIMPV